MDRRSGIERTESVRLLGAGDRFVKTRICAGLLCKPVELDSIHAREFESHPRGHHKEQMAERVRFELTCRNYPTIRFRVGAVMTASVPLRATNLLKLGPPRWGRVF